MFLLTDPQPQAWSVRVTDVSYHSPLTACTRSAPARPRRYWCDRLHETSPVVGELRISERVCGPRSAVPPCPPLCRVACVPGCGGRSRRFVRFEDVSHERGRYRPVRDKVTAAIPPPRYGALLFRVSRFDPVPPTRPGVRVALLAEPASSGACVRTLDNRKPSTWPVGLGSRTRNRLRRGGCARGGRHCPRTQLEGTSGLPTS